MAINSKIESRESPEKAPQKTSNHKPAGAVKKNNSHKESPVERRKIREITDTEALTSNPSQQSDDIKKTMIKEGFEEF